MEPKWFGLFHRQDRVRSAFIYEKIDGMNGLNYWERLNSLRLYSVQRRRERYIILYVFKILHNLVPNCGLQFQENSRTGVRSVVAMLKTSLPGDIKSLDRVHTLII